MRRDIQLVVGSSLLLVVGALAACGQGTTSESLLLERSIGSVHLKEPRTQIEHDLGKGRLVSSKLDRSARPEPVREEKVAYDRQHLVVYYISSKHHAAIAYVVATTSSRYRTKSGVGVGASLAKLKKLGGVECYGTHCQHFQGHNKPGTAFRMTAPNGQVAQILVIVSVD